MKHTILITALVVLAPVPASFPGISSGTQDTPAPVIRPPEWFSVMQTHLRPVPPVPANLRGTVKVRTPEKILEIRWTYDGSGGQRKLYDERIETPYWPTAAARICEGKPDLGAGMIVAGQRGSNGNTVIERWEPSLTSVPSEGNPTVFTKSVLYDARAPGKNVVRMLAPVYGIPGKVYLQFNDERSLYVMDCKTGDMAVALSASQVPELEFDSYRSFWGGKEAVTGHYRYVFQCKFSLYDDGAVILSDYDADGLIDAWQPVAHDEWGLVEAIAWESTYLE